MFEVLFAYFNERFPLTEEGMELLQSVFIPRHLEKGEIFMREGEIAKYGIFVAKGCMRSYVVDNKGKEHIVQFAPETWWISDTNSLLHHVPSLYFVDAIEDSDILLLDLASHKKLMAELPGFAASFQSGIQKHTATKDKRIISSLTSTAEERYENFLNTYPSIAQRVPQHMLASYLGVSPETLSRVRKKRSIRK